jgi:hypothetical protein
MDLDMEAKREAKPSLLAARQRRAQNFAPTQQMSSSMPSSTSTTSFPSPMNNNNHAVANPAFDHQMTAPLPSPSAQDMEPVYPRSQSAMPNTSNHHFQPHYQPQYQQSQPAQMQSNYSTQQNHPFGHQPHQGMPNNPAATTSFLNDFNLVAEAAKRAQIAVVMRDLEAVSL